MHNVCLYSHANYVRVYVCTYVHKCANTYSLCYRSELEFGLRWRGLSLSPPTPTKCNLGTYLTYV